MAYKIFIDGKEGTTGLKIFERFENRKDIEKCVRCQNPPILIY